MHAIHASNTLFNDVKHYATLCQYHKVMYIVISLDDCLLTVMQKAWRERNPQARIRAAYQAIEINHQ